MDIIEIRLLGNIWWKLLPNETSSSPLSAFDGRSIISPIAIDGGKPYGISAEMVHPDGIVLFSCNYLLLTAHALRNPQHDKELMLSVGRCLNALRIVSKQPQLPRSYLISIKKSIGGLVPPKVDYESKWRIRKYIADSAITWDHIQDASTALENNAVPVHSELLIDAAEAICIHNYRSAIIFAAMSIESCAGSVLDLEYNCLLEHSTSSNAHRLVTVTVNSKTTITKDPIYLAMRNGSGEYGSRFLTLLHECPLYLMKRSLMLDEPDTYQKAHSLYRTRNSLTHTGTTDTNKDGLLDVNLSGALTAVKVANRVLNWFGEKGTTVPDSTMLEC